jgi:hypothetical protein
MTDTTQAAQTSPAVSNITIQGLEFEVPRPYAAGTRELTAGEAHALNQTMAENLRNNFASTVKSAMDAYRKANSLADDAEVPVANLDHDALQAELDKYAGEYKFREGGGGGVRGPSDPIEREAIAIATAKVKAKLSEKGIKLNSVSKDKMAELVQAVIVKYPDIRAEAERRVKAAESISLDALGV